jgi:DNA-binding transcriptional ArsR family regulator
MVDLTLHVTIWLHTEMQALGLLADPIRREIIETLLEHEEDAGSLAARFTVSRPAVSRHLRVLREAGLVRVETEAQRRVYHVELTPLAEIDDWIGRYRRFWTEKLDVLDTYLEEETRP